MRNRQPPIARVRALREQRGLSQLELAAAVHLTRQSLGAIETGRATPAVDVALRIARVLDASVEDLFGTAQHRDNTLHATAATANVRGRLALARIAGRWVASELESEEASTSADALATRTRSGDRIATAPLRTAAELNQNLIVSGCATGLGLLADRLNSRAGAGRFVWLSRSSTAALEALGRGFTHVAGAHLVNAKSREPNVDEVRRILAGKPTQLITFARWEAGLLVAAGNPKRIRSIADLGRRGMRVVTREAGSGARALFEQELRRAGLPRALPYAAQFRARSHQDVARAIAIGAADGGVATRDVAIGHGLGFVPLAEERYDLALQPGALGDVRVQRLLDMLTSSAFRRELAALGYDMRPSGDRVAEVTA